MSKIFKKIKRIFKPKMPKIEVVEPPSQAQIDAQIHKSREDEKKKRKRQKGRAATMLSKGAIGDDSSGGAKSLLGD